MLIVTLRQLKRSLQTVKAYIDRLIPRNVSELENDAGYITADTIPETIEIDGALNAESENPLENKVIAITFYTVEAILKGEIPGTWDNSPSSMSDLFNYRLIRCYNQSLAIEIDLLEIMCAFDEDYAWVSIYGDELYYNGRTYQWYYKNAGDTELTQITNTSSFLANTFVAGFVPSYVKSSDLATVATSGSYNDLTDKPTIPSNYLTTESDPVFAASAAYGITSSDISNWNAKGEVYRGLVSIDTSTNVASFSGFTKSKCFYGNGNVIGKDRTILFIDTTNDDVYQMTGYDYHQDDPSYAYATYSCISGGKIKSAVFHVGQNDSATSWTGTYSETSLSSFAPVSSVDGKTGAVTILPSGGSTGQVLKKSSGTDYAVEWSNESGAVTDVQVGGTSVVSSGVANITIPSEIFIGSTTPSGYTLYIDPDGMTQVGEGVSF